MKDPKKVKQGKKSRKAGNAHEAKVRIDLEKKGWIVDKWTNNVEFSDRNSEKVSGIFYNGKFIYGKLVPSKPKFNPFTKSLMMNKAGFPDFIAYKFSERWRELEIKMDDGEIISPISLIGVEAKMDGKLDKEEKEKCAWLLENKIFSKILIAKKGEKRGEIVYVEFKL